MKLDQLLKSKPHLKKLLQNMPDEVQQKCIIKKYQPGTTMVRKDDPVENIYIVCSGKFRVINEFPNGSIYGFAYVKSSDFVGALELISENNSIACTVEAVTDCDVISINKRDFMLWYNSDHEFTKMIAKMLAEMFYATSYKYGTVFMANPLISAAKYITSAVEEKAEQQQTGQVSATRQFMADELGVNLRTVYRVIKKLKEKSLINISQRKITVTPDQYKQLIIFIEEQA